MSEKYIDTEPQDAAAHEHDCVVASLRDRIAELEARLEMDHHYEIADDGVAMRVEVPPSERSFLADGIECRDGTIALLDAHITKLKMLLEGRDKFIVDQGLWLTFVDQLPASAQAPIEEPVLTGDTADHLARRPA
jgi:hypothetical protein